MATERTIQIVIGADGKAAIAEMDRVSTAGRKMSGAVSDGADQASVGMKALGAATRYATAAFSAAVVVSFAKELHEAGMAAERLRNSFAAAAGGAENGQQAMAFARAEAQRLGLDLLQTSDAFLKITASAKGTALEGDKTRQIFSAVAGASRALGLSGEQMNGALLAISQMMSKGTVQAEELRGQLGERLPGAFNIAARSMGVTTAELGKMLESGKVLAEDFLPKFAAELQRTFPPGEEAMRGLTAETARLSTAWYELKSSIMEAGGESLFAGLIRGARKFTEELANINKAIDKSGSKTPFLLALGGGAAAGAAYGAPGGPLGIAAGAVIGAGAVATGETALVHASGAYDQYKNRAPLTQIEKQFIVNNFSGEATGGSMGTLIQQGREKLGSPVIPVDAEAREAQRKEMEREKQAARSQGKTDESVATKYEHELWQQFMQDRNNELDRYRREKQEQAAEEKAGLEGLAYLDKMRADQNAADIKAGEEGAAYLLDMRINERNFAAENQQMNEEAARQATELQAMRAAMYDGGLAMEKLRLDQEQAAAIQEYAMNTDSFEVYEKRKLEIEEYYSKRRAQLQRTEMQIKLGWAQSGFSSMASIADSFYQLSGKKSKEALAAYRVMKSGETIISTASSAMKAYDSMAAIPFVGPALGAAAAAAAVMAGAVQLQSIWSVGPDGSGGAVSTPGGGGGLVGMSSAQPPATAPEPKPPEQGITIHIYGNVMDSDKLARDLMASIRKAEKDGY